MKSLADALGAPETPRPVGGELPLSSVSLLEDITDAKKFAEAVLNSQEFRTYIVHGLTLGNIPAAVLIRVMDLAGWQKPPERFEHTGKDGNPIETVTEVKRVIVRARPEVEHDSELPDNHATLH